MEIERKYVLDRLPEGRNLGTGLPIQQGYVSASEDVEVRLRRAGDACRLTVKRGSGLEREEWEVELENRQLERLWPATAGRRLEKTRYRLEIAGGVAELDCYHGELAGLVTVEVEFRSTRDAEAFKPPSWFGVEVTGDDRWANRNLAAAGRPNA